MASVEIYKSLEASERWRVLKSIKVLKRVNGGEC